MTPSEPTNNPTEPGIYFATPRDGSEQRRIVQYVADAFGRYVYAWGDKDPHPIEAFGFYTRAIDTFTEATR